MKRASFAWTIGGAVGGALLVLGGAVWISAPKPKDSTNPARLDAGSSVSASADTSARHPRARPEKSLRVAEPVSEDEANARMASPARLDSAFAARARSLDAMPAGEERTIAMRTIFRGWAAVSPQDALAWISTMSPEHGRDEAREFVCYRVAEDDPKLAFDLARQAGAGTATPLVWDLAQQWAGKDVEAARDWALALPAGADRDQILTRICYVLSQSDPSAAGALVSGEIAAGPVQDEAAMSVLHQWAIRDFDAVSEWVATFPESPLRTRAEAELAGIREGGR